jgi:hypothetical protein
MTSRRTAAVVKEPAAFTARDDAAITAQLTRTVEAVRLLKVTDHASYAQAGEDLLALKQLEQGVHEHYDEDCATANKLHKSLTGKRTAALNIISLARQYITAQRTTYSDEQERLRLEAERAATAAAQAADEARALEDAALLEVQGHADLAASVIDAALATPAAPIVIPADLPKTEGVSPTTTWAWELLNQRLVPEEYKTIDEKKVGAVVRALKGETRIPGIRVYPVKGERVTP